MNKLLWKSWYAFLAVWCLTRWVLSGMKTDEWIPGRRKFVSHVWTMHMSMAALKTGDYRTLREVIDELRK